MKGDLIAALPMWHRRLPAPWKAVARPGGRALERSRRRC